MPFPLPVPAVVRLGVNPFNQPGVEAYKTNMFALLGKPGFAARREDLLSKGPS